MSTSEVDAVAPAPRLHAQVPEARRLVDTVGTALRLQASRIAALEAEADALRAALATQAAADPDVVRLHRDAEVDEALRAGRLEGLPPAVRTLGDELVRLRAERDALRTEVDAIHATRTMRLLAPWRRTYGRLRHAVADPRWAIGAVARRIRHR
ncbi:hypothetical protein [Actinomarinicola tropica]|uniref:Uncharacterized protein n=1 Tax=Actinomarinicola tropica TaxID=2789776 RepID=A0A5Q2RP14_9ACTN|nr:hypothetical protein [Actinomarinicola tropica]QGG96331.1 hypothetical protein GH723_15175 [Actinomarinicola tropica]